MLAVKGAFGPHIEQVGSCHVTINPDLARFCLCEDFLQFYGIVLH
jgi:hypothetical protein